MSRTARTRPFDALAFIRAMVTDPEERVEWVKCLQWLHSLKTHEPSRLLRWDKEEA